MMFLLKDISKWGKSFARFIDFLSEIFDLLAWFFKFLTGIDYFLVDGGFTDWTQQPQGTAVDQWNGQRESYIPFRMKGLLYGQSAS